MSEKIRLDKLLVSKQLADNPSRAKQIICQGGCRVNGKVVTKPGLKIAEESPVEVDDSINYVGRGAFKLLKALEQFSLDPEGLICLDVGCSTGGFTEVLLEQGAAKVVALDIATDQLHPSLMNDERVVKILGHNAREALPTSEKFPLIVMDLSFISALKVLSNIKQYLTDDGDIALLFKPQFEAGRELVRKGLVKLSLHPGIIKKFTNELLSLGLERVGFSNSPIEGKDGNHEYLMHIRKKL